MIITSKTIVKTMGNRMLQYYRNLGYDTSSNFEVLVEHLTNSSKSIIKVACDICGNEKETTYSSYMKNVESHGIYSCSNKCAVIKTRKTNLEKYGVEFVNQSLDVRAKSKKTNLERYGFENASESEEIKLKCRQTNLERYGVEYVLKLEEFKNKSKQTNLEKYGVEFASQSEEFRDRVKQTLIKNWGVDNPSKSEIIKNKKRETSIINWGVDNPSKSLIISEKKRLTNLINNGVEYPMQSKEIRQKSKYKCLELYGVDHNTKSKLVMDNMKSNNLEKYGKEFTLQVKEIRDDIDKTNLENYGGHPLRNDRVRRANMILSGDPSYKKYDGNNMSTFICNNGHEYNISSSNWHSREKIGINKYTVCNPIGDSRSIKEDELYNFILSNYSGEIVRSYRDKLEIDIYLPDLKIGFEFNGLYWHSDKYRSKNYHFDKTKYFLEKGIRIIHIWEDDWSFNCDIVKSQIRNWLGKNETKIFARKCKVVQLKSVSSFLNKNHIQGVDQSSLKLGLYYNDDLVSVMTFNTFEGRKKMEDSGWNLSRFCNKIGTNVIGGASKLLKYFVKNYNPIRVVSYADKDWSVGNLYYQLGFNKINESLPDYKYIVDNKRIHKSNFKKSKLKYTCTENEYIKSIGVYKIWDCGKIKFELNLY
jgi:hypothetical protein